MDNIVTEKICKKCGCEYKTVNCSKCKKEHDAQYRVSHLEEKRASARTSYKKNILKNKEYRKKYYLDNAEKINNYAKKWKVSNKDKVNALSRKRRANNLEEFRRKEREYNRLSENSKKRTSKYRELHPEKSHEYYEKNKDTIRNKHAEYYEKNKDKSKERKHRRRALLQNLEKSFTAKEWRDLRNTYKDTCLCCGSVGKVTADHITPLSKGGAGTIDNIQPLCKSCNSKKGVKIIDYRKTYVN